MTAKRRDFLAKIFGRIGRRCNILPPFRCDYGFHIEVGENFFANYNFVVLDGNYVRIGDNMWIGGSVSIVGGVTIGDNAVVAAGSVVIRDVPAGTLVAGNPARVVRKITKRDRQKYKWALSLEFSEHYFVALPRVTWLLGPYVLVLLRRDGCSA